MRTYFSGTVCPKCKETPKRNRFDSRWQCACEGKVWSAPVHGQRGAPEEHGQLTDAGFQMTTDTLGDTYYLGPSGHVVWLFNDGTWRVNPDAQHGTLEEYLERVRVCAR
jgi:hypothetical protein